MIKDKNGNSLNQTTKFYENEDKQQFYCDECGICRGGLRENYFHCKKCNMCLHKNISSHKCIENVSRRDCPICLQDLHIYVLKLTVLTCGHMMHEECCGEMIKSGRHSCQICMAPFTPEMAISKEF